MNTEIKNSPLKMTNLHFPVCSVHRNDYVSEGELSISVRKEIIPIKNHSYSVTIILDAERKETADLSIHVEANAVFYFEGSDSEIEKELISKNAVAIMMPYVRSQVTILTSQPNLKPVILPIFNVTNA